MPVNEVPKTIHGLVVLQFLNLYNQNNLMAYFKQFLLLLLNCPTHVLCHTMSQHVLHIRNNRVAQKMLDSLQFTR